VKWGWIFLLTASFLQQGFALDETNFQQKVALDKTGVEERIELLEEKRGLFSKHRKLQSVIIGEFLYWKADVDGVAYATTSRVVDVNGGGTANSDVKTRTPHFSYDPGFRLAFEVQAPFDLFDFGLVWTRIFSEGNDHARSASVDRVITDEIGLIQPLISNPSNGSADCHIRGDILDLQFARGIEISKHFFLRPYFGARAIWSQVHWDISMKRHFVVPFGVNQDSTVMKVKNDFRAVGGLVGLELDWELAMGFGISSKGRGALVYGPSEEKTRQDYVFLPAGSDTVQESHFQAKNSTHSVKGLLGFFLGVFWEKQYKKTKHEHIVLHKTAQVRVQAGYEFQQWPYTAQKTNTQSSRERDRFSVGFQGFTGGLDFAF
jgi:hypothetical protein